MKNKLKYILNELLFYALIVLFILSIAFFIDSNKEIINDSKYNITQEVCENVTIHNLDIYNNYESSKSKLMINYLKGCMFYGTGTLQDLKIEYMWDDCKHKPSDINCSTMKNKIDSLELESKKIAVACEIASKDYKEALSNLDKAYLPYNETVCSQKEVDEIKVEFGLISDITLEKCITVETVGFQCTRKGYGVELYADNESEIEKWIYEGRCDGKNIFPIINYVLTKNGFPCINPTYKEDLIKSKEDITKEWLEENCETKRCTACEDLSCKNQKCDLYYCFDKYIVEVLN